MRQAEQEAAATMRGTDEAATSIADAETEGQTAVVLPSFTYNDKPEYQRMFIHYNADIIGNEITIEETLTSAREAVDQAAARGDEAAYAAALAAYESAIENAFGISIESEQGLEPTLEALDEYRAAAEADAAWFEQLWCGEDAACYREVNRYALYRAASGNRVISRIDVDNLPGYNPYYLVRAEDDGTQVYYLAPGYTAGTTLYDIFGGPTERRVTPNNTVTIEGERTVDDVMIAENVSHEAGHSLLFSSGLGNLFRSPLQRLLSEDVMAEALGTVPGGLTPSWSEIGRDTRQNPGTDFSELQADTFLFTSQGQYEEFARFTPVFQSALRQAILSNTPPRDYYQALYGTEPNMMLQVTAPEGINSRIFAGHVEPTTNPAYAVRTGPPENLTYQPIVLGGETQGYGIPPDTNITVFGRSETPFATLIPRPNEPAIVDTQPNYWVYGGWYDDQTSSYRYGWISGDVFGNEHRENIANLEPIPFASVDPARL